MPSRQPPAPQHSCRHGRVHDLKPCAHWKALSIPHVWCPFLGSSSLWLCFQIRRRLPGSCNGPADAFGSHLGAPLVEEPFQRPADLPRISSRYREKLRAGGCSGHAGNHANLNSDYRFPKHLGCIARACASQLQRLGFEPVVEAACLMKVRARPAATPPQNAAATTGTKEEEIPLRPCVPPPPAEVAGATAARRFVGGRGRVGQTGA